MNEPVMQAAQRAATATFHHLVRRLRPALGLAAAGSMPAGSFLKAAMKRPAMIGSVAPSSQHLARAMARAADGATGLIELGAGTGAITQGLRHRHPQLRLLAVEQEGSLASLLQRRFPQVEVCAASAHTVLDTWREGPSGIVVVSSLPFRSLPPAWRRPTIASIEAFLLAAPGRRLVQYTYQPRVPFDLEGPMGAALHWQRRELVWRNLPPAWVWTLQTR